MKQEVSFDVDTEGLGFSLQGKSLEETIQMIQDMDIRVRIMYPSTIRWVFHWEYYWADTSELSLRCFRLETDEEETKREAKAAKKQESKRIQKEKARIAKEERERKEYERLKSKYE